MREKRYSKAMKGTQEEEGEKKEEAEGLVTETAQNVEEYKSQISDEEQRLMEYEKKLADAPIRQGVFNQGLRRIVLPVRDDISLMGLVNQCQALQRSAARIHEHVVQRFKDGVAIDLRQRGEVGFRLDRLPD